MARRATKINSIRAVESDVLVLEVGNSISGARLANQFKGKPNIEAMNLMGYSAMAIGENELIFLGIDNLKERAKEAKFPFLSANIVEAKTGRTIFTPFIIKEIGDERIAIIGITSASMPQTEQDRLGISLLDPIDTAKGYADMLRKDVDLIIVLSNLGYSIDQQLAQQVESIDVIIGANNRSTEAKPVKINESIIAQGYVQGRYLGYLRLKLAGKAHVTSYEGELIKLDPDIADDKEASKLVERYEELYDKEIGNR